MEKYDTRQDDYIAKSAEFAQPVLIHLRQLIHDNVPQITETMKWGMPFFDYKGPVCQMAAFKQHCTFGFWKGSLLDDPHAVLKKGEAMGSLGKITSLADLPPDAQLAELLIAAVALNQNGVKLEKAKPLAKAPLIVPGYFTDFLKDHPEAQHFFDRSSASHKKEYVQWITEAKTEATRIKRMLTAAEWLSQGKQRNWKYQK